MTSMIGYARVSTTDQNIDSQLDFLNKIGCHKIFQEKISATSKERVALQNALKTLSKGDTLIVLKLDRLGRSVKELISIIEQIQKKEAHLKTLDGIDTTKPHGIFIFHIFSALAEMELSLIKERTKLGLISAKERGKIGGRPRGVSAKNLEVATLVSNLYQIERISVRLICEKLMISKSTLYHYLRMQNIPLRKKE